MRFHHGLFFSFVLFFPPELALLALDRLLLLLPRTNPKWLSATATATAISDLVESEMRTTRQSKHVADGRRGGSRKRPDALFLPQASAIRRILLVPFYTFSTTFSFSFEPTFIFLFLLYPSFLNWPIDLKVFSTRSTLV